MSNTPLFFKWRSYFSLYLLIGTLFKTIAPYIGYRFQYHYLLPIRVWERRMDQCGYFK